MDNNGVSIPAHINCSISEAISSIAEKPRFSEYKSNVSAVGSQNVYVATDSDDIESSEKFLWKCNKDFRKSSYLN